MACLRDRSAVRDIITLRISEGQDLHIVVEDGAEQITEEAERSLHDAIMVVKSAVRSGEVGGAIEIIMNAHSKGTTTLLLPNLSQIELSVYIRKYALSIPGKKQLILTAVARALEIIPCLISENAGIDSTDVLNKLRMRHAQGSDGQASTLTA